MQGNACWMYIYDEPMCYLLCLHLQLQALVACYSIDFSVSLPVYLDEFLKYQNQRESGSAIWLPMESDVYCIN